MKIINDQELLNISGGGFSFGLLAGIGALIVMGVGIIDGYLRPKSCEK